MTDVDEHPLDQLEEAEKNLALFAMAMAVLCSSFALENTDQNNLNLPIIAAFILMFIGICFSPIGPYVRNRCCFHLFNETQVTPTPPPSDTESSELSISQ